MSFLFTLELFIVHGYYILPYNIIISICIRILEEDLCLTEIKKN
jgi:hypothetical protein